MAGMEQPGVRGALLDAAYDAAVTTGWARARMADVAAAAGVSRQTLYDQFGTREALAQALALRELDRFLDGTERALHAHGDLPAAVEAATRFTLEEARANPLVHAMITESGEDGLLPLLTTRAAPLLAAARARLARYFREHHPEVPDEDAELGVEICTRLTLSYVVLPSEPPAATARRVATLVARVLDLDARRVR